MKPVILPRPIVNQILHQAQQAEDQEIFGLIAGNEKNFTRCYPVENTVGDKHPLFEMDPKQLINAVRTMRERGEELKAIYHSHPDAPAQPSLADIRQHEYPDVLYLMVSLATRGVLEIRGFSIRDSRIENVEIGVQD